MSDPAQLEATVSDLQKRISEARCVFEFTVSSVPVGVQLSESDHRHALGAFFRALQRQHDQRRTQYPKSGASSFFKPDFDTSMATATTVELLKVTEDEDEVESSWFGRLEKAFMDPPYGSKADTALFAEFCATTGIAPDAVVLDWVGDRREDRRRSAWSNYFDAGREWWGIWCATIWNPTTCTLAVIAASSTD